jgi:hypothetical protein
MIEICHNIEPYMQPSPARNPGGDCFACSLTAILRHIFPDNPPEFDQVFDYFYTESISGKPVLDNIWSGYRMAVCNAKEDGYDVEIRNDFVVPIYDPDTFSHNWWSVFPSETWCRRLEAWLSAGWIAVAEIDSEGRGPMREDGKLNVANHFIAIDGIRTYWKDMDCSIVGAKRLAHDIHVVCSSKGAYWIDERDLLQKYGAAGLWLIRRDKR